jgi:hypothetical protein
MVEDLIKRLSKVPNVESLGIFVRQLLHEAADAIESANTRLTALESERDALLAAAGKEAVKGEPVAWAVYWGIGEMRPNSVHFEKQTATNVAAEIKSNTEIRPLYTAPIAAPENGDGRDAWLLKLYEVLMQQNIVTSEESYLSLRCVGVPPTEAEFATAVQRTIDAALSQKAGE